MLKENPITLGSLFDGIVAFPLCRFFFGITPLWASEILPNSVSVTKKHFPEMEHLGDITKLDAESLCGSGKIPPVDVLCFLIFAIIHRAMGGKIPPVDVLCFGSSCQSFSVAGLRTSFEGKYGLFFETIRIIREMRCATYGKYPRIAIRENVPGVLNIDGGRSYKTIIEVFTETEVPMPVFGKWTNAGMVRGGSVDFVWGSEPRINTLLKITLETA
jgi:DNA (cytosine-5)-methyltransferase 1